MSPLAAGGTSSVYLATDPVLDRRVVIKFFTSDRALDSSLARFSREVKALSYLNHPNIVELFDYGETEKYVYLVLEYMDGGSLEDEIIRASNYNTFVDADFAIQAVLKVGSALSYAHTRAIVHRDVKPSNILLSLGGRVAISDFDLWLAPNNPTITLAGMVYGTPMYMAPEQILGKPADPRTDIYALGLVLYELLAGRLPYDSALDTFELIHNITQIDFPNPRLFNSAIPLLVSDAIMKSLDKDPANRFQTMADFMQAIDYANQNSYIQEMRESSIGSSILSKILTFFRGSRKTSRALRPVTQAIDVNKPAGLSSPSLIEKVAFARLAVLTGPYQSREYQLKETTIIGREQFEPTREDPKVSRRHARIGLHDGQCFIEDLHSRNGTLINGTLLEPGQLHMLQNLDEIRVGSTVMLFTQTFSTDQIDGENRARLQEFDALWEGLIKAVK